MSRESLSSLSEPVIQIDADGFTEEERERILRVVAKDEDVRLLEKRRLDDLKRELRTLRAQGVPDTEEESYGRVCKRCRAPLGIFVNSGEFCPSCGKKVCKECRVPLEHDRNVGGEESGAGSGPWECSVCSKFKEIKAESGAWFYDGAYNQPEEKKKQIYGSMLLKKIFKINRKQDYYIYKDPVWQEIIQDGGDDELPDDAEDFLELIPTDGDSGKVLFSFKSNPDAKFQIDEIPIKGGLSSDPLFYNTDAKLTSVISQELTPATSKALCDGFQKNDIFFSPENDRQSRTSSNFSDISMPQGTSDYQSSQFSILSMPTATVPEIEVHGVDDNRKEMGKHSGEEDGSFVNVETAEEAAEDASEEEIEYMFNNYGASEQSADRMSVLSENSDDDEARPLTTVAGELFIGLTFDDDTNTLKAHIHKAKDLLPPDGKSYVDPYVKVYLSSDKRSVGKQKTRTMKNTTSPVFDEVVAFHVEDDEDVKSCCCNISVWHYDFSGKNVNLGEVDIDVQQLITCGFSLHNPTPQWYTLQTKRVNLKELLNSGHIVLSLNHRPNDRLDVTLVQTKGLHTSELRVFAKLSLVLPEGNVKKMKSKSVDASPDPYWEEDFLFEQVSKKDLQASYLQISVRCRRNNESVFIAGTRLGLGKSDQPKHDSFGEEVKAWKSMLDHPNEPQDVYIPLRSTLNSIKQHKVEQSKPDKDLHSDDYGSLKKRMKGPLAALSGSKAKLLMASDTLSMASSGSLLSLYSNAGGDNNVIVSGEILLSVKHCTHSNLLTVCIDRAKDIAAVNVKHETSDPYCKIYLLPDKSKLTKKKTTHRRKTTNPQWNESVKYSITREELLKKTLQVSLWNHDRLGRNDFLGEVQVNISDYSSLNDLDIDTPTWYTLQEAAPVSVLGTEGTRGEITIGLQLSKDVLTVYVIDAKGLYATDTEVLPNSFVKCYLLPDKSRKGKRKTSVQKKSISPHWDEKLEYKGVNADALSSRVLEVTIWDYNSSAHQFLGGVRLGLPQGDEYWHDCVGNEAYIWEDMMKQVGEVFEYTIPLRATMTSKKENMPPPQTPTINSTITAELEKHSVDDSKSGISELGMEVCNNQESSRDDMPPAEHSVENASSSFEFLQPQVSISVTPGTPEIDEDRKNIVTEVFDEGSKESEDAPVDLAGSDFDETTDDPGELMVSFFYDLNDEVFEVRMHQARNLLDTVSGSKMSLDPYAKVHLSLQNLDLGKRKTKTKKNSCNPEFDEVLSFKVAYDELNSCKCFISVWHKELTGKNIQLGEFMISVNTLLTADGSSLQVPIPKWYTLHKTIRVADLSSCGDLVVNLQYNQDLSNMEEETVGTFYLNIVQAKGLKEKEEEVIYCNASLYFPNDENPRKMKTREVIASKDPFWEEEFVVENISKSELEAAYVQISVRRRTALAKRSFFASGTRLGMGVGGRPCDDSYGEEVRAWSDMLDMMNKAHFFSIPLRSSLLPLRHEKQKTVVIEPTSPKNGDTPITPDLQKMRKKRGSLGSLSILSTSSPRRTKKNKMFNADALSIASSGSMMSLYSNAGGLGSNVEISGEILFSLKHDSSSNLFNVCIERAKDIAVVNTRTMTSDPYCKVYLLPDPSKTTKKKTTHRKRTLNPDWSETIKYKMDWEELMKKTLTVSVWNHDRFGRNDFLGEVQVNISDYTAVNDLEADTPMWYTLQEMAPVSVTSTDENISSYLNLSMKLEENVLHVEIKDARNLQTTSTETPLNSFVKLYLLPDKSSKGKRKTRVQKKTLNPCWNEKFEYKGVSVDELHGRVLEVTVWDHNKAGHQFLGGLRLGLAHGDEYWHDCSDQEVAVWMNMMNKSGVIVECDLPLRTTMTSKKGQMTQVSLPAATAPSTLENIVFEQKSTEGLQYSDKIEHQTTHLENGGRSIESQDISSSHQPNVKLEQKSTEGLQYSDKIEHQTTHLENGGLSIESQDICSSHQPNVKVDNEFSMSVDVQESHDTLLKPPDVPSVRISLQFVENDDSDDGKKKKKKKKGDLKVTLKQAFTLPMPTEDNQPSTYCQVFLHPKKKGSQTKTEICEKSCEPVWDSEFVFKGVKLSDLEVKVVEVFVLDAGQNDDMIGFLRLGSGVVASSGEYNDSSGVEVELWKEFLTDPEKVSTKDIPLRLNPSYASKPAHVDVTVEMASDIPLNNVLSEAPTINAMASDEQQTIVSDNELSAHTGSGTDVSATTDLPDTSVNEFKEKTIDTMIPEHEERSHPFLRLALWCTKSNEQQDLSPKKKEKCELKIHIKEAFHLPTKDERHIPSAYCKAFIHPKKKSAKMKTKTMKSVNPFWDSDLVFEGVSVDDLHNRALEIALYDQEAGGKKGKLGYVRLGLGSGTEKWNDSRGEEVEIWKAMLEAPDSGIMMDVPLRLGKVENGGHTDMSDESLDTFAADEVLPRGRLESQLVSKITPPLQKKVSISAQPAEESNQLKCESTVDEEDIDEIFSCYENKEEVDYSKEDDVFARPCGDIKVGLVFDDNDQVLEVQIHQARNLVAPNDTKKDSDVDSYAKVYFTSTSKELLEKKKTKVKKNTLSPVFDEVLLFNVEYADIIEGVCNVSVWQQELRSNVQIGEVDVYIKHYLDQGFSLINPNPQWYSLHKKVSLSDLVPCGEFVMTLKYETKKQDDADDAEGRGELHISIDTVKNLKIKEESAYCNVSLVLSDTSTRSMKTQAVSTSTDPYWEESFIVDDLSLSELRTSYLQITVRGRRNNSASIFVACTRLGGLAPQIDDVRNDAFGDEVKAWRNLCDVPNKTHDVLVPLRSSADIVKQPSQKHMDAFDTNKSKKKFSLASGGLGVKSKSKLSLAKQVAQADTISVKSSGSFLSIYSNAGGENKNLAITGDILFSITHDTSADLLTIHIDKAKDIAAVNAKQQTSDPYCKIYLFPDQGKLTKKKTTHRRKTISPQWNESVKYTITREELLKKTLQVSVWNHDRLGRNDFLGEVQVNIGDYSSNNDLDIDTPTWYTLQEAAPISVGSADERKGELTVGLRLDGDNLSIHIKQASGLCRASSDSLPNSFVKLYLLPDKSSKGKRKSGIQKKTLDPCWNEKFEYKGVTVDELYGRVLEVTVWDHNKAGHQFLGGLRLGLPHGDEPWHDCLDQEVAIWTNMMKKTGEWIESIISLRSTMTSTKMQMPTTIAMMTPVLQQKLTRKNTVDDTMSKIEESSPRDTILSSPLSDCKEDLQVDSLSLQEIPEGDGTEHSETGLPTEKKEEMTQETTERAIPASVLTPALSARIHRKIDEPIETSPVTTTEECAYSEIDMVSTSIEEQQFIMNESDDEDNPPMTGAVKVGLMYNSTEHSFEVQIHEAKNLDPVGELKKESCDPYAKVYITSNTRTLEKKKTKTKKNTLNPTFDEVVSFKMSIEEAESCVCNISIWNHEFAGNTEIGEADINIQQLISTKGISLSNPVPQWSNLYKKDIKLSELTSRGRLMLNVEYKLPKVIEGEYFAGQGQLHVNVVQAKGLKTRDKLLYCKICLVPAQGEKRRFQGKSVEASEETYWDEDFLFDNISLEEVRTAYLQVSVRGKGVDGGSVFLAGTRLGLGAGVGLKEDSFGEEVTCWETVLDKVNTQHDVSVPLRNTLQSVKGETLKLQNQVREAKEKSSYELSKKKKGPLASLSTRSSSKMALNADALSMASSSGSMLSIYSNAGGHNNNIILSGDILFSITHNISSNLFTLKIEKAKDIAAVNAKQQTSDPYCKIYLFPDQGKLTKKKTTHRRKTINPEWNESVKYTITREELLKKTLQVSVWNHDRLGRNDFLGEVQVNMGDYSSHNDLDIDTPTWYTLQEAAPISVGSADERKGELTVGLRFDRDNLNIHIKQASGLCGASSDSLPNSFVKLYLLPDKSSKGKRKSGVQKKTLDPCWNEKFEYKGVTVDELYGRVLEITVWDHNKAGHQFLGGLRLGLSHGDEHWHDCEGKEVTIWESMMKHAGILAEYTLSLRPSMTSQKLLDKLPEPTNATVEKVSLASVPIKEETTAPSFTDMPGEIPLLHLTLQHLDPEQPSDPKKKKKKKGTLRVLIHEATNLPCTKEGKEPAAFCRGFIHPRKKTLEMKTDPYMNSCDPVWNSELSFEGISIEELLSKTLEIEIFNKVGEKVKEPIGFVRLSGGKNNDKWDDSTGAEVDLWTSALSHPGQSCRKAVPVRVTQKSLPDID